ncbi:hypothetical protein GRAN_4887 [Granulicella sibirica]|uniref:Clostripain n=1 Tax=Granulicella sibirica TaxID=2479048 RepID=A0A4Q0SYV8_9BACT|nr:hypothetical protein GRAN_4887 [Granulicella sibirica]
MYVYFAADVPIPAMTAAARETLQTLISVGSTKTIKFTAMIDLPERRTEYYIVPEPPEKAARWPVLPDRFRSNVNSAAIDTVRDFFAWSTRNCPADNIALIFWGHGYALDDYDPRAKTKRAATAFPGDTGNELKLLYDDTHKSVLNNRDFAKAIRDYTRQFNGGKPVQIVGLDCCNMAMAEVLSELQDVTQYVVAAETELPFQSWLTRPALQKFVTTAVTGPRDLAVSAVKSFIGLTVGSPNSYDSYVELSVCDLTNFGKLEAAMSAFAEVLTAEIKRHDIRRAVAQAWYNDVTFLPDGMIDLSSFCRNLEKALPPGDARLKSAASDVSEAVEGKLQGDGTSMGGVVDLAAFAPSLSGRRIAQSRGISIWFPPWIQFPGVQYEQQDRSKRYLARGYSQTRFAIATAWDRFLHELLRVTQS